MNYRFTKFLEVVRRVRIPSDDEAALDAGATPGAGEDGWTRACQEAGGGREDRAPLRGDAAGDGRARGGREGQVWCLCSAAWLPVAADDVHGRGGARARPGSAFGPQARPLWRGS